MILKIANEADRQTVAGILFKNGYSVKKIKAPAGSGTRIAIEYEEQEKDK